jgi:hypothetical protein
MASHGASVRAGTYAEGRYRRGLRAWRSRTRLIVAACFGPFIVAGLAGLAIEGHVLPWAAGVMFGAGAVAIMVIRDSPPAYVENWRTGAEGEQKTEEALERLDRSRWFVAHDVQYRRGNYDHIVVGPAGVFLLDSKNPQGILHMRDGEPYLRRPSDSQADTRCRDMRTRALAGAASLYGDLKRLTGCSQWVQAVVVVWSDFDEGLYEDEKCVFVHGSELHAWLAVRPEKLDAPTARELVTAVEAIAAETPTATGADSPSAV